MRNYIFLLLTVLSLNTIGQDIIFCGTQSNNTFFSYDPITRNSNLITPGQTLIRRIRVDQNLEQVFWSAGALNKIQKVDANLVGSNRVDVKTNLTNVATINVAAINNKVYYHLGNGSAIFSCDTNGNNTSTLINLGGSKLVLGIEIDIDNSFIYWTEITPSLRTIRRANLITGGNQTTIYSSTDLLFDIKLLAEDSSIYFTNRNGNKVQKIKTDGTGLQTIVDEPNSFTIGTISGDYCNNVLYYYLVGAGNGVQIKKVALNSTTPSVVLDTSLSLLNGLDVLFQFNIGKKENFLGPNRTICFADSTTLNAKVRGGSYLWNNNSTSSALKVKQSGMYSVTVTAGNCAKVDSITVTVNTDFTVDVGVDSILCFGDSIVLDATMPSASYLWSDNSSAATLKVKQTGTFWADVTVNGCTKRDSITINIDPSIQPTLGNDTSICFGDSITLNTSVTGAANLWNDNSTNSTLKVKQSGIYSVTVTAGNCTKVDSITITVNPNFTVDIGVDTTLCFNDSILLNATTLSASYLWSNNSTTSGLQISSKGTYWVDVSVNGCTKRDSISIIIHDELPLFLGNDTTICFNDSVQFNLDFLGYSYLWSDGSTDSVFTIKREGAFWADLTLNGCVTRDSIYVSIFNSTLINLGNDTTLCFGDSIILNIDIPPPVIVKWSDNSTNSSLKVKSTGFYYVDVTLVDCTIRDSIAILFTSEIGTNFFPNDTTLCNGDSIDFDFGQPNQSYLWSDSTTISSNTFKQEGLYWLEISENGCASRDSLSLRIKEQPIINLGPDTSLCEGELFGTSYSNLNTGYLWNTGSNDTSIAVKTTGIYWLEVLLDGCIFRDSIALQVKPIPSIDLGPDTTLCFGDTIALSQSSFTAMYLWNDSTTGVSIETFRTGNYWLDFTVNGCSTRDSIRIETFDSLGASFLPQTATLCGNGVLNYQLPLQNSNYRWQDGSLDPNYSISDTGLYFVQVSNTCGSRTDSLQVTKDCECKVSMPNAFTPNNDLINDQFIARISCELEFYAIEIYNRWGGKVFESVQQKQAWDGTINGRKPKNGVYYYVLRYKTSNENVQTLKGSLLLSQ